MLKGIPFDIDIQDLQKKIAENTVPPLTPSFDELFYKDHSIRLLIMNVSPGIGPYTTADGTAVIRKGKECLPYQITGDDE